MQNLQLTIQDAWNRLVFDVYDPFVLLRSMIIVAQSSVKKGDIKMAAPKKTTAAKPVEAKVVAPKAEELTTKVTAAPAEEKKKPGRKPAVKKAETAADPIAKKAETTAEPIAKKVETAAQPVTKKAEATAQPVAKKAETPAVTQPTVNLSIQFAGKSYTQTDFAKMAMDVWQYDLGKPMADLQSVDLYVKPEESMTYYVFNGQDLGGFAI
jgi:outer membrane biosynthesis protein TonB